MIMMIALSLVQMINMTRETSVGSGLSVTALGRAAFKGGMSVQAEPRV